ncbi:MAG: hypothetical protein K1X77_09320 [Bacteroidia bacterium]|nr:hypothetical protein [Bacteroidia bacterium]
MYRISYFIVILLLFACSSDTDNTDAVARVFDKYLSRKEVLKNIPYGASTADSTAAAKDYIEQWIRKQAVLRKAELNLNDEQKEVSNQLEDYKSSLLIFAYEQELIRQKMDTIVPDMEIENYYKSNPGNFELKNNIIKLWYVKLPANAPNPAKVKTWLQQRDRTRLEQYCQLNAINFLVNDDDWLMMDDVIKEIPIADYNESQYARNVRMLEIKDANYLYLVNISGFMVKESQAPLSFVKENIRDIILNKRKIKLIQQMQEEAYSKALDSKDAEVFTQK